MDQKFGQRNELEARRAENFTRRAGQSIDVRMNNARRMESQIKLYYDDYRNIDMSNALKKYTALSVATIQRCRMTPEEFEKEYPYLTNQDLNSDRSKSFVADVGWNSGRNGEYVQVNSPNGQSHYETNLTLQDGRKVAINLKEYFTFTPSGETRVEILEEADKYYKAAAIAFKRVDELAKINNFKIGGKISPTLVGILNNMDSLVVYASSPNASFAIRLIFEQEFTKVGLKQSRPGRPKSSVDVKLPDGTEFSGVELVAKAISKNIVKDYQTTKNLKHYNEKQLEMYITKGIENYNMLSSTELLNRAL